MARRTVPYAGSRLGGWLVRPRMLLLARAVDALRTVRVGNGRSRDTDVFATRVLTTPPNENELLRKGAAGVGSTGHRGRSLSDSLQPEASKTLP